MSYSLIASNSALAEAARTWRRAGVVALDTEFIRTRTFYPIAALYQLASDGEQWLVDPLEIDTWTPLVELLADPAVVKVMHACGEDLEVFARHLGATPAPLFDTQVAEGFLSPTFSTSYAELVRRHADAEIGKHETRSDWLARPLADEQVRYAVEDVSFLGRIHADQRAALVRLGRLDWFEDECRERCRLQAAPLEEYYLNVRGAVRCDAAQLRRLRRLCVWRETRARARDLPRGRVTKDEELLALACIAHPAREDVFRNLHPGAARRHWHELIEQIEAADAEGDTPVAAPQRPLTRAENDAVKRLRDCAAAAAEALGMAVELLARRRDLETLVRQHAETGGLSAMYTTGWRAGVVGSAFAELLAEALAAANGARA
jgi:ribonuclease D